MPRPRRKARRGKERPRSQTGSRGLAMRLPYALRRCVQCRRSALMLECAEERGRKGICKAAPALLNGGQQSAATPGQHGEWAGCAVPICSLRGFAPLQECLLRIVSQGLLLRLKHLLRLEFLYSRHLGMGSPSCMLERDGQVHCRERLALCTGVSSRKTTTMQKSTGRRL